MKIPKKGKIRTTQKENIELQKFFIENGYRFVNGNKDLKIFYDMDFFYFDSTNKTIAWGAKNSIYIASKDIFSANFYSGETRFLKNKTKEFKASYFINI